MKYPEWRELHRQMAVEQFVMQAADCMVPVDESRPRAIRLQHAADTALAPEDQGKPSVRDWRNREHVMGEALIALEKLGYEVKKIAP